MEGIYTRQVESEDFTELMNLYDDKDTWAAKIPIILKNLFRGKRIKKNVLAYVAIFDERIIGFVYGQTIGKTTLFPQFLFVNNKYRRNGVGKLLIETLEVKSKCQASLIYYHKSLHTFYENQGYQQGTELEVAMKELQKGGVSL